MQKAKNDQTTRRFLLKRIIISIAIIIAFVFGLTSVVSLAKLFILNQTSSGEFVAELPTQLVPTAVYLLNHPQSTPSYLKIGAPIDSKYVAEDQTRTQLCVFRRDSSFSGLYNSSRFFVNGSRLPAELTNSYSLMSLVDERDEKKVPELKSQACVRLVLKPGLHLIGFQPSVLENLPIYQWAIEIE